MASIFGMQSSQPEIHLYNTLSRKKEAFVPVKDRRVHMYTCGPTVYDYAQIGNLRSFVFADIVRRVLEYNGYEVKQIVNITDVGALVGDGDEGEDKMTAGLKREGMELTLENMKALGEKYTNAFVDDLKALNIQLPFAFPRASEHIREQIAFISTLMEKGYAYKTSDGIYFETEKFPTYGALGGSSSVEHSRIGVKPEKRDPRDFTLWKFNANLGWESPWGRGFPGWHIECSAMSTKYLGNTFDIHTGGIDLIAVHHNNEIAQSEAATGKPFVKYWMHGEFITIDSKRIGKSEGNAIRLGQLAEQGVSPLAYRYFLLGAHYRSPVNFTWNALEAAATALYRLYRAYADLPFGGKIHALYRERFQDAIGDDIDIPKALALLWDLIKDETVSPEDKRSTIADFDRVLGLGLGVPADSVMARLKVVGFGELPEGIEGLLEERERARSRGDFARADEIRKTVEARGYVIEDGKDGPVVRRAS